MGNHPDSETLSEFSRLSLEQARLRRTAWHLFQCRSCRRALARASPEGLSVLARMMKTAGLDRRSSMMESEGDTATAYGSIFSRVRKQVAVEATGLEAQRRAAPAQLKEILAVGRDARRSFLEARPDLHIRPVAEQLIIYAQRSCQDRLAEVEAIAQLALIVIAGMRRSLEIRSRDGTSDFGASALSADLEAEAWSVIGNARRIGTDLHGAERALARAGEFLAVGTGDPLAWAQVASYEASLRRAQCRFDEAYYLLDRALRIFERAGDRQAEARTLVKRALTASYQGQSAAALEDLDRARRLADFDREPRLELTIEQNALYCLKDGGRFAEALALLPRVRHLSRQVDRTLDRLDLDWLEGQLFAQIGDREAAERKLEGARKGYIRQGIGYRVALVSLDLAALLLEDGRDSAVRILVQESLPIFLSRDLPGQVAAALAVFRQAALAERATVEMVQDLAELLKPVKNRG